MQMIDDVNMGPLGYDGVPEPSKMEDIISASKSAGVLTKVTDQTGISPKITYSDIESANASMTGTDIKGKIYMEVNQRIKAFRMICPNGAIITEMISNENGVCIFRATVYDENGTILGTGTAYEKEGSTYINKTSYIENAETSAVGRALGMCGLGIDTSVASADEVTNAINNQGNQESHRSPELICPQCKKPIKGLKKADGTVVTAQQVHDSCNGLCLKCYQENKKAIEAASAMTLESGEV